MWRGLHGFQLAGTGVLRLKNNVKIIARLFRSVLLNQANAQFHQLKNLEFRPTSTKPEAKSWFWLPASFMIKSGEFPDVEIFWRVVTLPEKPAKIIDVEVENISMLKTQQDENTTLIRRSGGRFAALNDAMRSPGEEQLANQQANVRPSLTRASTGRDSAFIFDTVGWQHLHPGGVFYLLHKPDNCLQTIPHGCCLQRPEYGWRSDQGTICRG